MTLAQDPRMNSQCQLQEDLSLPAGWCSQMVCSTGLPAPEPGPTKGDRGRAGSGRSKNEAAKSLFHRSEMASVLPRVQGPQSGCSSAWQPQTALQSQGRLSVALLEMVGLNLYPVEERQKLIGKMRLCSQG